MSSSQCGQLADYSALEGRLAPSADAGFMSPELVAGWVGAAKGLYDDKPQLQRDEAIRSATFGAGSLLYASYYSYRPFSVQFFTNGGVTPMIYELRNYTAQPGRLRDLLAPFENH